MKRSAIPERHTGRWSGCLKEKNMTSSRRPDDRRRFLKLAAAGLGAVAFAARPAGAWGQSSTGAPLKIGSVGATSINRPRYMTPMRSAICSTMPRSCVMNR